MNRILDLDLDFFVHEVAYYRSSADPRLPDNDFPAWILEEAMTFLTQRCRLTTPLPGFVVEHHSHVFSRWRAAIRTGGLHTPFHVTHVDAHADLGLGDASFKHLITDVLHRPVEDRAEPQVVDIGIGDGNWLAYAIACRWITDVIYVFNDKGGDDLPRFHLTAGDDPDIQLKAATPEQLDDALYSVSPLVADRLEPVVPLKQVLHSDFEADTNFDAIVLCRSPGFTPASADVIFNEIRHRFVDESVFT